MPEGRIANRPFPPSLRRCRSCSDALAVRRSLSSAQPPAGNPTACARSSQACAKRAPGLFERLASQAKAVIGSRPPMSERMRLSLSPPQPRKPDHGRHQRSTGGSCSHVSRPASCRMAPRLSGISPATDSRSAAARHCISASGEGSRRPLSGLWEPARSDSSATRTTRNCRSPGQPRTALEARHQAGAKLERQNLQRAGN